MTGEITLRGRVLPIGGLKSKILAAHLAGARMVVIPKKNEKDVRDIPEEIRKQIKIVLVESMGQVLETSLRRRPRPLPVTPKAPARRGEGGGEGEGERPLPKPSYPPEHPAVVVQRR